MACMLQSGGYCFSAIAFMHRYMWKGPSATLLAHVPQQLWFQKAFTSIFSALATADAVAVDGVCVTISTSSGSDHSAQLQGTMRIQVGPLYGPPATAPHNASAMN
mmetsp:Transcript_21045/g.33404  ORF Transcript_21045/g.33404 Transcript_21045/m.33404 type:complete len:105 (+) Transcript_21045:118-432(+)